VVSAGAADVRRQRGNGCYAHDRIAAVRYAAGGCPCHGQHGVVLRVDYHLLYGRVVTLLTVQNGALVLRGTSLGTGQGCCCGDGGEPCDPCAFSGGPETYFPYARLVGTWDIGGGPTAFDWLAPADQLFTGYINRGWANNSRSPQGTAASAPDTRVHATVWKWDGSTETCDTLDEFGEVVEAEVPALRTCGDSACSAWFYGEPGSVNAVMSAREYRTLIANPPPDDGQWYTFIYIEAISPGPLVWYWAWIPYCTQTCGEVALSSDGPWPDSLVIDTFTLTCEMGDACCAGNDEYPIYKLVNSECDGHNSVDYAQQQNAGSPPPCLGACCYNDGIEDVCGGPMSKAACDALSGTWHSGEVCAADPCNLFP